MAEQIDVRKPNPLAEVFGFSVNDFSERATRFRKCRLCPFSNKEPNCTKSSLSDPIGVCSLYDGNTPTIICPVRFQQDWYITTDAAEFFFPEGTKSIALPEVRLKDKDGKSAGNIDFVLVSYDDDGKVVDFGAVEVQSVYISGNIKTPFKHYVGDPSTRYSMDWTREKEYPRPDYLSSTRKRLVPQLIYKGQILHHWKKKIAVVVHSSLFATLPTLPQVKSTKADVAWLVYDLVLNSEKTSFTITHKQTVYTEFQSALDQITTPVPGDISSFVDVLQKKLDEKREKPDIPSTEADITQLGFFVK